MGVIGAEYGPAFPQPQRHNTQHVQDGYREHRYDLGRGEAVCRSRLIVSPDGDEADEASQSVRTRVTKEQEALKIEDSDDKQGAYEPAKHQLEIVVHSSKEGHQPDNGSPNN